MRRLHQVLVGTAPMLVILEAWASGPPVSGPSWDLMLSHRLASVPRIKCLASKLQMVTALTQIPLVADAKVFQSA